MLYIWVHHLHIIYKEIWYQKKTQRHFYGILNGTSQVFGSPFSFGFRGCRHQLQPHWVHRPRELPLQSLGQPVDLDYVVTLVGDFIGFFVCWSLFIQSVQIMSGFFVHFFLRLANYY